MLELNHELRSISPEEKMKNSGKSVKIFSGGN